MGVAAAKAAGMVCGAVTTSFSAAHLMALPQPPDFTCRDFEEFLAVRLAPEATDVAHCVQTITRAPSASV